MMLSRAYFPVCLLASVILLSHSNRADARWLHPETGEVAIIAVDSRQDHAAIITGPVLAVFPDGEVRGLSTEIMWEISDSTLPAMRK